MRRLIALGFIILSGVILAVPGGVRAQGEGDTCPGIALAALTVADQVCAETGRNQACYGHLLLEAEPQPGVVDFAFERIGDIVDAAALRSLRLSPMDTAAGSWGVALLRLQADLPETMPGENVTLLLFGDTQITAADRAGHAPMQAFYLSTGLGDAPCRQAPDSGLLIQTPVGGVTLIINETTLLLGSTAYVQAQAGGEMAVNVLEGQAQVTAQGVTQTAPAGARVRVPLDANLAASGAPLPPEPYDEALVNRLPVDHLERPITVAPPLRTSLIVNGDFSQGLTGWQIDRACNNCIMEVRARPDDPHHPYMLAWERNDRTNEGGAIWARQAINLDASACRALNLVVDVWVGNQTLPNSGWWSDEHGGNGEYPVMVNVAFTPAFQGEPFAWAHGFLYQHDGATRLSNYTLTPREQWITFEANILAPEWWVDGFDMPLTNPGMLTEVYVGGSGWDFAGGIANLRLTGCDPAMRSPAAGTK